MYPFMGLSVHFHTFIPINRLDLPVNLSNVLYVHRYQYTCSVYFLFFCVSYAMTFQLIYWSTYPQIHPKIHLPVYIHASLSSNHKDLPVTTTTCLPAHICTRSWSYLFILILSFRLTVWIPPSTFLLFYTSTDVPVHHYTVLHVHRCTCS